MKQVKDHLGITYPSIKAMCEAYGISRSAYNNRKRLGWDLQDSLTKPVRINKTDNN